MAFDQGQALAKFGDLPGARDALEEASLRLDPEQFSAHLLLGAAYLRLNSAEAADDQFEIALLLQPKSVEAQLGAAGAGDWRRRLRRCGSTIAAIAEDTPKWNANAFRLLAQAYNGMGKEEEADRAEHRAKLLEQGPVHWTPESTPLDPLLGKWFGWRVRSR